MTRILRTKSLNASPMPANSGLHYKGCAGKQIELAAQRPLTILRHIQIIYLKTFPLMLIVCKSGTYRVENNVPLEDELLKTVNCESSSGRQQRDKHGS